MELIIFRDIQADSIGLIRQKVEKHGEEYHYIEVTHRITGLVFPTYSTAMSHYEKSKVDILKALNTIGVMYQVL
jgi:hypothetical protein